MQATRPDSVRARLVFVNLLKCNSQGVAKRCLIHVEHQTAHADWLPTCLSIGFEDLIQASVGIAAPYGITGKSSRRLVGSQNRVRPYFVAQSLSSESSAAVDLLAFTGIVVNLGKSIHHRDILGANLVRQVVRLCDEFFELVSVFFLLRLSYLRIELLDFAILLKFSFYCR